MLSYLHDFHAGNHADVLKHWLLLECVQYLQEKNTPFDYIDTHAGAGLYHLKSARAQLTKEAEQGVLKINRKSFPELAMYFSAVEHHLAKNQYAGSPLLVKRMLREHDKAWLFELHPKAFQSLKMHCEQKRRCHMRQQEGLQGLLSLLPVKSGRALVLIDPSYEIKTDYQAVVETLIKAFKKMPQAVLLLWYPVVNRATNTHMEKQIKKSALKNVQLFEMGVADDAVQGMSASGLIMVNAPWTLAARFKNSAEKLSIALSQDGKSRWRFEQLVGE